MATAHVQTKDAQTASGTTLAVNLTGVVANNHLCATTAVGGAGSVATSDPLIPTSTPTATWANAVAGFIGTGANNGERIDYSENVASGSWTVNIRSNTTKEVTGIVSESSGVATTGSLGAVNHGIATATTVQPGSITPTAGSILYTSVTDDDGVTSADTINSSFSVSSDATAWNGANQRAGQAHLDNVAASAVNPTWTAAGSVHQTAAIAEFLAAAGGTGLPPGLGPTEHMQPAMTMPIGW